MGGGKALRPPLSAGGALPRSPVPTRLKPLSRAASSCVAADMRFSYTLLCQGAGGEVLRVTTSNPTSPSGGDGVSTQAASPALHPGLFTPKATQPPGRLIPQVNIDSTGRPLPPGTQWPWSVF